MSPEEFFAVGTFVTNLLLGTLVLFKNRRSKVNIFFALFVYAVSAWIVTLLLYYGINDYDLVQWFGRVNFVAISIASFFVYRFSYYYPVIQKKERPAVPMLLMIITLALVLMTLFTPFIAVEELVAGSERSTVFGSLYILFPIHIITFFLWSIVRLISKARKIGGVYRVQIFYFLFGFGLTALLAIGTNVVLPFFFSNYSFQLLAPVFTIVFVSFTSYSIVRYKLLEIRSLISRSVVFFLSASFVSAIFIAAVYVGALYLPFGDSSNQLVALFITAVLAALFLEPVKNWFSKISNSIFFNKSIDYDAAIKQLTDSVNREVELDSLVKTFSLELETLLSLKDVKLLLHAGGDAYILTEEDEKKDKRKHADLKKSVSFILGSGLDILSLVDLNRRFADAKNERERKHLDAMRGEFEVIGVQIVIPIYSMKTRKKIEALVLISEKKSGAAFSTKDLQLFEVLAPQLASGLQKARLYQEAKEFGNKLQREVEKATAELKSANKKLKELDNAKSEFMSIASHQLRTPLAGIMGYLSMITAGDYGKINKEQEPVIKDVLEATRRLIRMVNIFLNATRIEAGRFVMNYKKVPFEDVIDAIYKELKPTADAKGVQLTYKKTALGDVEVDVDKIKDVILNLTDNAIKYSPEGKVVISAEMNKKTVHVMVKDSGVGIAPDEVGNLFSKFVRGSGIARVEPNGSGLGLFIAKKITEGHGGKIWAESEGEGKGSTFQFEIPIKADKTAKKKAAEFKARAKKKEGK